MNKDQLVRYKVLDRCLRNPVGCFGVTELIEQCNRALSFERATDIRISERTVREDLRDIQERYGAVFDASHKDGHKKLYRYEDSNFSILPQIMPELPNEKKMLQQVLDALSEYENVPQYNWLHMYIEQKLNGVDTNGQSVIGFQNNPDLVGMEHFSTLLSAILAKQPLEIKYQPYKGDLLTYRSHPYYLKQYNDRWFLVAKVESQERLTILPLDRIESVSVLNIPYICSPIDMETYFDDIIGITKDERKDVEDVMIRISHSRYPYLRTKPLHYTQREIHALRNEEGCVICIRVRINKELEAAVLQLGSDAEVLQPEWFRGTMASKINALNIKYSNSANALQG